MQDLKVMKSDSLMINILFEIGERAMKQSRLSQVATTHIYY